MNYKIDIESTDGIVLLRPKDEDLGPEQAEALKEVVRTVSGRKPRLVVINFSLVEYMSSVFLSALVEIYKDLHAAGIKFAFAELNHKNLEIIKTTKLDSVFPPFSSVHDACASIRGDKC